jgi:mannose-6-phosphate isomerase-like protein (cupin superfamily)
MFGWVEDIERVTLDNDTFRTEVFTGPFLQITVMSIRPGEDIGKELHPDHDQFIRIEQGSARVEFGRTEDGVDESHDVGADWAFVIPAGTWHNVVNTGPDPLKLYSIYAPPQHPRGTVHRTRADAMAAEHGFA